MNFTNKWRLLLIALGAGAALVLLLTAAIGVGLAAPNDPIQPHPISPMGKSRIGDYVWRDANVDGFHETTPGEQEYNAGINGVLINLYLDSNTNGQIDPGEYISSTLTGDDPDTAGTQTGWYNFGVTAEGNQYIVEIDPSNFDPGGPLEGMVLTSYNTYGPLQQVILLPGLVETWLEADFGFIEASIEIAKTPDLQYVVAPGTANFTIQITNTGSVTLTNVTVTDPLASGCNATIPSLAPGATVSYSCSKTGVGADFTNVATVTGTPTDANGEPLQGADDVTDQDDAVVDVVRPGIQVVKTVSLNGTCPGSQSVSVLPGTSVTYCYQVTNTGDTSLSNISVTDNVLGSICTISLLAPSASQTCTKVATVTQDTTNVGTATGQPSDGQGTPLPGIPPVTDDDDAVVDVVNPAIQVVKTVSLDGTCPGSQSVWVLPGTSVTYCYQVTNTGDTYLSNISVTDNLLGSICTIAFLGPTASVYCTRSATISQDTTNIGTATGQPSDGQGNPLPGIPPVTDDDDAVVDVVRPGIQVVKTVSLDGTCPGGQSVLVLPGTTVTYCYEVTNTGDTSLSNISVTDNVLGSICTIGLLAPSASQTCTKSATVTQDTTNVGTATGQPSDGQGTPLPGIPPVTDDDDAVVDVVNPGIQVVKTVSLNGTCPGSQSVSALPGTSVTYCYQVTNTGDTYLSNISVTDNVLGSICTISLLAPLASQTCTKTATVTQDTTNVGTATGQPSNPQGQPLPNIPPVTDDDDAVVDVVRPGIQIVKTVSLNGACPGGDPVLVPSGTTVTYCYQVINTGDTYLSNISVTDDLLGSICTIGLLAPTASQTCTKAATVTQNTTNVGTATGQPSDGQGNPLPRIPPVTDDDDATVTMAGVPGIVLVKTAGNAPDGQVLYVNQLPPVTILYTFQVTNTGTTHLSNIEVTDSVYGAICTIPGPLAPGQSASCTRSASVPGDVTNVGTATGTPTDANGTPTGQPPVSDTDDAVVQFVGSIGDFVWWDVDGDGIQDPGEPGIPNVDVVLTLPDSSTVTTTTDPNGNYTFPNLPPGIYIVTIPAYELLPGGTLYNWSSTYLPPMPVNLGVGQNNTDVDFGWDIRSGLELTKTLNNVQVPVRTGNPISFTIRITNTGNTWISVLPLRDVYDTNYLTYGYLGDYSAPASDDNTDDGQIDWSDLTVSFGTDLAPGAGFTVVITFTAKADTQNLPNKETINTAIVQGAYGDPDGPQGPLGGEELLPTLESSDGVSIIQPTGFDLAALSAEGADGSVRLTWQTVNERNIFAFRVLRQQGDGGYAAVNQELILARHAGANRGDVYSMVEHDLQPGRYAYILEVVQLDGGVLRYGPVQVALNASN